MRRGWVSSYQRLVQITNPAFHIKPGSPYLAYGRSGSQTTHCPIRTAAPLPLPALLPYWLSRFILSGVGLQRQLFNGSPQLSRQLCRGRM